MNARRLAVTETNMAYRTADYLRWQNLDFVTGIEVRLSNNHNCKGYRKGTFNDICDDLQGRYPKDFKFTGWHPHCRCVAIPILKTPEEVAEDNKRIMQGKEPVPASDSPEAVKILPKAFTDWTKRNADRIETARGKGTLPYFLKDNEALTGGKGKAGAKRSAATPSPLAVLAKALGIETGKPMTFEEADHRRGNPHRKGTHSDPYNVNCQSCVVAYEARLRGLDVAAMPNFRSPGTATYRLSRDTSLAWIDPNTGKAPSPHQIGGKIIKNELGTFAMPATLGEVKADIDSFTRATGRYDIAVRWKECRSGHIFTLERKADGTLLSYDPQTGERNVLAEYLKSVDLDKPIDLLRVDGLRFNPDIASRVLIKQSAPRLASFSKAREAKGGVLGAPKKQGKLVTSEERKAFALKSKNERDKFDKEQRMCKVLADNGHDVVHLPDSKGVGSYDITLDGVPYELKSLSSSNNIRRHANTAIEKQKAKGIVFELAYMDSKTARVLHKLTEHGIHGYYYIKTYGSNCRMKYTSFL